MDPLQNTPDLDEEARKTLARCSWDLKYCGKTLFPDIFEAPFSGLHNQVFDLIGDVPQNRGRKIAIQAPRGIGKTSIAQLIAKQAILYRSFEFVCYIQNSATLAEMQTENIKRSLISNQMVRNLFGSIKISDAESAGLDESFSKSAWVAYGKTLVLPRGSGQQVRGLNWSSKRPQLIIIDDLEDKDECRNEEIRGKQKDWLLSDVLKSVNKYVDDWIVIYIDTLKHEDSVLQMLLDSSDWESISLAICDGNYKSYDLNYMTDAEIAIEVEAHREKGKLDVFYMEYMGIPVSTEDAVFKPDYFKYYDEVEIKDSKDIENIVILDPAKTVKIHSAESAILGLGIDRANHRIYVRDVVHRKMYPDQIYQELFEMADRLGASVVGVEITSLEEFIKQPLINEMMRRGRFYEFVWLKARGGQNLQKGKEGRVAALAPFYRQGFIYHNKTCCADLEGQLLAFPKPRLWDIIDGLAYIVEMMELGGRYFQPPEEFEDPEEEYAELEDGYDPVVEDWRMI